MSKSFVYMTCADKAEAETIGAALVEQRLAACVNILDGMTSMYWWEGKVETAQEVVLIAKTRAGLIVDLTKKVKELHSYDVPCIISMDIEGGNRDFIQWIKDETHPSRR